MKAYLMGGPANGRVILHPHDYLVRIPIPRSIDSLTITDCLQESINDTLPMIPVATYQFTGQATVNLYGDIQHMLYRYTGMDA
jgi:hypothetical protein